MRGFVGGVAHGSGKAIKSMADDPRIEKLKLIDPARAAAASLLDRFQFIEFTSGRRTRSEQAHAMASNTLRNRNWIRETYKSSLVSRACQSWIDRHPSIATLEGITAGLTTVLNGYSDKALASLSDHFSGLAFDVLPVHGAAGHSLQKAISELPGLKQYLTREGGLERWHLSFYAPEGIA